MALNNKTESIYPHSVVVEPLRAVPLQANHQGGQDPFLFDGAEDMHMNGAIELELLGGMCWVDRSVGRSNTKEHARLNHD